MMRSILNRLGLKKLVAVVVAATVLASGGVVLAQSGDESDTGPPDEQATTQAIVSQDLESRYVPVTPCRLVDTRQSSRLAAGELRAFQMRGNLSGQGGPAGGCDIPARAGAIAVNLTSVFPSDRGFLRAGPTCTHSPILSINCTNDVPNATVLNYSTALNASNGVDIPVCSQWTGFTLFSCKGGAFVAKAFTADTHLVVDVTGYYARPIFAIVDGDNSAVGDPANVVRQSGFAALNHTGTGQYVLDPVDDIRGCAITTAPTTSTDGQTPLPGGTVRAVVQADSDIVVNTYNSAGTSANGEFTVVVAC